MKIQALAPWYGSKRTLAPRIITEIGEHKAWYEPCCGSLAVTLAKDPCSMETVNDLHGDLVNLARVLAHEVGARSLYESARRVLSHEGLHAEFKARIMETPAEPVESVALVSQNHVDRALAYLAMSWLGRNGSAGTRLSNITVARRYTSGGGSAAKRWHSAVESIPDWHERLRQVNITQMCMFELLERIADQAGTVIYLDPPYLRKTDNYIHDADNNLPIVRKVLGLFDWQPAPEFAWHQAIAMLLSRFKRARVIVSYYDEPELHDWYFDWTFVDCPITKGLVNQGRRDSADKQVTKAPEILIINGPSYTANGGLFK